MVRIDCMEVCKRKTAYEFRRGWLHVCKLEMLYGRVWFHCAAIYIAAVSLFSHSMVN